MIKIIKEEKFFGRVEKEFVKEIEELVGDKVIIFGAGKRGYTIYNLIKEYSDKIELIGFSDNNKQLADKKLGTLNYISPDNIADYSDAFVLICSQWEKDILKQLKQQNVINCVMPKGWWNIQFSRYGFQVKEYMDEICNVWYSIEKFEQLEEADLLEDIKAQMNELLFDDESKNVFNNLVKFYLTGDEKYFDLIPYSNEKYFSKLYGIGNEEVFVDCGAYTGDTIDDFIRYTGQGTIYAFEPDPDLYHMLVMKYNNDNIHIINAAVSNKKGKLLFGCDGEGGAVNPKGDICVDSVRLDESISETISLLKMDNEGAEMSALEGAEQLIYRSYPKLAICVYHKWNDIYKIPFYIHEKYPEYKIALRHHSKNTLYEFVMYAWI